MKTEGQIKHKFKQAKFRHFQKRSKAGFKRVPCNCMYNKRFVSDGGKTVGMCHYQNMCEVMNVALAIDWKIIICDDEMPEGVEQAKICPVFEPRQSKQDIKNEIDEILTEQPLSVVAHHFPDLVALLWVLDQENEVSEWLTASDSWEDTTPQQPIEEKPDVGLKNPEPIPEENTSSPVQGVENLLMVSLNNGKLEPNKTEAPDLEVEV